MDLNALAGQAGALINEHGDKIEAGAEQAGEFAKDRFGHDEQVDMVVDKIQELIPGGEGAAAPQTEA